MKKRGFSFLEVLVSAAILTVIIAGILMVLRAANISWDSFGGALDVQQQARQAMHGMIRELRQSRAQDVSVANLGAMITFLVPDSPQAISYYLENNQIIREHPLNNKIVLANDINTLVFSLVNSTVTIQMEARKTVKGRIYTFPLSEKAGLRNE